MGFLNHQQHVVAYISCESEFPASLVLHLFDLVLSKWCHDKDHESHGWQVRINIGMTMLLIQTWMNEENNEKIQAAQCRKDTLMSVWHLACRKFFEPARALDSQRNIVFVMYLYPVYMKSGKTNLSTTQMCSKRFRILFRTYQALLLQRYILMWITSD